MWIYILTVFSLIISIYCFSQLVKNNYNEIDENNKAFMFGCIGAFILIYCCFNIILVPIIIYTLFITNK